MLGELAGIETYVLRPTPAAGAAWRLRARSFRVRAFLELLARRVQAMVPGLAEIFVTGDRFLLAGSATMAKGASLEGAVEGAERIVAGYQRDLDQWTLRHLRGELMCRLAAARCDSGRLPIAALEERLAVARLRPLEGALVRGAYWNPSAFHSFAGGDGEGSCPSCGATAVLLAETCGLCQEDQDLAQLLPHARAAQMGAAAEAPISIPGAGMSFAENGDLDLDSGEWPLLRHVPGEFDDMAGRLAYLSLDADGAAQAFAALAGDPEATRLLSRRLRDFFTVQARHILEAEFPKLYPVYGGGDSLLVVGPGKQALHFALRMRESFPSQSEPGTISASLTVEHPQSSMRSAFLNVRAALGRAKQEGGGRISICGTTRTWEEAGGDIAWAT